MKQVMSTIKFFVGVFPAETRKKMRQNLWLFNLYSRSLQKSGLFYGFPTPQKLQKLYIKTIVRQSIEIEKISAARISYVKANCCIALSGQSVDDLRSIKMTLANTGIRAIYLTGEKSLVEHYLAQFAGASDKFVGKIEHLLDELDSSPLLVLRGGDILHSSAVSVFAHYLQVENKIAKILYCDIDSYDSSGKRHIAEFFPAWNPDLQLTTGYVRTGVFLQGADIINQFVHFVIINQGLSSIALWMSYSYLQDRKVSVNHIPLCLLHQTSNKPMQWHKELAKLNRTEFVVAKGEASSVAKLEWHKESHPLVTLVIPTKNAKDLVQTCITSILAKTSYQNFEILLIDNNSDDQDALAYFETLQRSEPKVSVLSYPYEFNYSAINNFAVRHAKGEIVGLINNDIEVISANWLADMVGQAIRSDIGCVGAKLLYPDTRIQHAGVVMGYGGGAGHAHKYFPRYHPGYLNRLAATHNYSAVTAACLLIKKVDFDAVGGLNEKDLTVAFNDVDFCLRILALGRRNLYCAEAELFHHESVSRGADDTSIKRERFENELTYLQSTWADIINDDPAYNPNLTLRFENFSIKD